MDCSHIRLWWPTTIEADPPRPTVAAFRSGGGFRSPTVSNRDAILPWREIKLWRMPMETYIALIDDDEFPAPNWLLTSLQELQ